MIANIPQQKQQKQPFADALQNWCSEKFRNIRRKTPVLESLFNKGAGLMACNIIKKRLQDRYFPLNNAKLLRTAFFKEHLRWLLLLILCKSCGTLAIIEITGNIGISKLKMIK